MDIDEITKKIESELKKVNTEIQSNEGLLRLQEVAAQYNGEYRLIWSKDLLEQIKARPQKILYETGIKELDELIGGFREQQLITLSAHSKHGKTSFGTFMLERMEKLNPVMIPLEQSNEEIVEQRAENGYTIPNFLSPEKLASKVTVDWIEERIIEGIAKFNTKFVMIDHLGYIDNYSIAPRENLAYRLGEVMRALKGIAKRWNVVIILLVHISQGDEGKPPSLEDLKNSSDILQESDMVIMLWRKNEMRNKIRWYEDKTLLSVKANRRTGKNGNVGLSFNRNTGGYDPDNDWVKQMEEIAKSQIAADEMFGD